MHQGNKTLGQGGEILTIIIGTGDDLVVNIGDIAHIGHLFRTIDMAQVTVNDIKHHQHPRMTNMAIVIYRHTTHVHSDTCRIDRNKAFLLLGKVIMYLELVPVGHGSCPSLLGKALHGSPNRGIYKRPR